MAPARQQLMAAREKERFPTEWALYDGDEQEASWRHRNRRMLDLEAGAGIAHRDDLVPSPPVSAARSAS